jgi:pilus assembly protein CpaB
MSARQLIVLVIAAIAAIGALLLIRGMSSGEETAAKGETIPGEQVLVAARDIPQGAALQPSDFNARLFPQDSINPQFVRAAQQQDYVGAVTRRPFITGEPIIMGAVIQPADRGLMAAQLPAGYRAVAIKIDAETAAGGYIHPNDRVDVILTTRRENAGGDPQVRTDVVLADVRVLALDDIVQPQSTTEGPERIEANVAVLELSAADARVLAQAEAMGDVSLSLRGVESETADMNAPSAQRGRGALDQAQDVVRVHSFGTVSDGASR